MKIGVDCRLNRVKWTQSSPSTRRVLGVSPVAGSGGSETGRWGHFSNIYNVIYMYIVNALPARRTGKGTPGLGFQNEVKQEIVYFVCIPCIVCSLSAIHMIPIALPII